MLINAFYLEPEIQRNSATNTLNYKYLFQCHLTVKSISLKIASPTPTEVNTCWNWLILVGSNRVCSLLR
jgi:hypothetical protein